MRLLLVVSMLIMTPSAFAQESKGSPEPPVREAEQPQVKKTYLIQLVEFQLNQPASPSIAAEELLNRLDQTTDDTGIEVLQTFHLSTLAGQETMAQVERQTAITTGVAYPQGRTGQTPPIRSRQHAELGTTLTVKVEPAGDELSVQLKYASSRIQGERPEDGPPDIVSFTIQSQLLVASGQRVLLGGVSGATSSYAVLTVTER